MNEKKLLIFIYVIVFGSIAFGLYHRHQHHALRNSLESANAGELQRQLESVTTELERATAALLRAEQSVGELEELDRRRAEGLGRIHGIIDDAGKSVIGVASGDQRARIAFEAIARIVDILEAEP